MYTSSLYRFLPWTIIFWTFSFADQIVYLDRPASVHGEVSAISEPVFNPNTLNAAVGEQVHFVARFGDQRPYNTAVLHPLSE